MHVQYMYIFVYQLLTVIYTRVDLYQKSVSLYEKKQKNFQV